MRRGVAHRDRSYAPRGSMRLLAPPNNSLLSRALGYWPPLAVLGSSQLVCRCQGGSTALRGPGWSPQGPTQPASRGRALHRAIAGFHRRLLLSSFVSWVTGIGRGWGLSLPRWNRRGRGALRVREGLKAIHCALGGLLLASRLSPKPRTPPHARGEFGQGVSYTGLGARARSTGPSAREWDIGHFLEGWRWVGDDTGRSRASPARGTVGLAGEGTFNQGGARGGGLGATGTPHLLA